MNAEVDSKVSRRGKHKWGKVDTQHLLRLDNSMIHFINKEQQYGAGYTMLSPNFITSTKQKELVGSPRDSPSEHPLPSRLNTSSARSKSSVSSQPAVEILVHAACCASCVKSNSPRNATNLSPQRTWTFVVWQYAQRPVLQAGHGLVMMFMPERPQVHCLGVVRSALWLALVEVFRTHSHIPTGTHIFSLVPKWSTSANAITSLQNGKLGLTRSNRGIPIAERYPPTSGSTVSSAKDGLLRPNTSSQNAMRLPSTIWALGSHPPDSINSKPSIFCMVDQFCVDRKQRVVGIFKPHNTQGHRWPGVHRGLCTE